MTDKVSCPEGTTIDKSKLLLETLTGSKYIIKTPRKGEHNSCTSSWNISRLPREKPKGKGWRFGQDLRAINKTASPHTVFSNTPLNTACPSATDLGRPSLSIPGSPNTRFMFAFTQEERWRRTRTRCYRDALEVPRTASQVLSSDLQGVPFFP